MGKKTRRFISMMTTAALFGASFMQMMPTEAASMRSIYYSAGDVDNMVSSSTFIFAVPEGCSFEYCDSSRFSRKGYKIASWYVQETGETVGIQQPSFMPAYDLHVIANWEPVKYSVCFAGVGGVTDGGENNIYVDGTYGTSIELPSNPFHKDGYTFAGWEYEGNIYEEGTSFEIPALISGSRVVLAAVWKANSSAVTDAPENNDPGVTTTTTTALSEEQTERFFFPENVYFRASNEQFKLYISEILRRSDKPDSITFEFKADTDVIGSVNMGFATTLKNGQTYQQNFGEYVNSDSFTITVDKNTCEQLSYDRFFQFVCWDCAKYPLQLVSVKSVVRDGEVTTADEEEITEETTVSENNEEIIVEEPTEVTAETEPVVTDIPVIQAEETTATTTVTTVPEEEVTVTAAETTTEVTTYQEVVGYESEDTTETNSNGETTATTVVNSEGEAVHVPVSEPESEPATQENDNEGNWFITDDNGTSRVLYVGKKINRDSMEYIGAQALLARDEKLVRMEITLTGENIGQFSFGTSMNMADGYMLEESFSDYSDEPSVTLTLTGNPESAYIGDDSALCVGYWWGEADAVTLESIKVYYDASVDEDMAKDYDGDGVVTSDDVSILQKYLVCAPVEDVDHENNDYDVNNDGDINVYDSVALQRMI